MEDSHLVVKTDLRDQLYVLKSILRRKGENIRSMNDLVLHLYKKAYPDLSEEIQKKMDPEEYDIK